MNAPIGDSVGALLGLVAFAVGLALYIWTALALAALFRKMGEAAWKGWVPVLNVATVLSWGGFSPWILLIGLFPVLGPVALWVLVIVAAHRINIGFGYGGGMTVLAALLFVVWASILGFGPSRWLGPRPAGASAGRGEQPRAVLGGVFAGVEPPLDPDPQARLAPPQAAFVSALPPEPPASPVPPVPPAPDVPPVPPAVAEAADAAADPEDAEDDLARLFAPPPAAAPPSWEPPQTRVLPEAPLPADSAPSVAPATDAEAVAPTPTTAAPAPAPAVVRPPAPAPVSASAAVASSLGDDEAPADDDAAWPSEIDDVSAIAPSPFPPSSGSGWRHAMPPVTDDAPIDFVPGRRSTALPLPGDAAAPAPVPAPRVSAADAAREPAPVADPEPDPAAEAVPGPGPGPGPEAEPPLRRARPWPSFAVAPNEPDGFPELSGEVSAVIGSPAAGSPRAAAGAVAAQHRRGEGVDDDDLDQTIITRRSRTPVWQLVPVAGPPVPLTSEVVILGRRPAGDPAFPAAQLVAVPGEALTVSKTHARLERHGDVWTITDLASTNGVLVRTFMGEDVEVEPGSKIDAGERFFLGDEEFHLQRIER